MRIYLFTCLLFLVLQSHTALVLPSRRQPPAGCQSSCVAHLSRVGFVAIAVFDVGVW